MGTGVLRDVFIERWFTVVVVVVIVVVVVVVVIVVVIVVVVVMVIFFVCVGYLGREKRKGKLNGKEIGG